MKIEYGPITKFIVREFDGELEIAKASLIIDTKDEGRPSGLIENVWTHPDYRLRGLASTLVEKLIDIAKEANCYKVNLSCDTKNVHLYNRTGFYIWQKCNAARLSREGELNGSW